VNLTIITDGNLKFGLGHILRSKTLAKFLIKDGHKVDLIVLSEINIKALYISNDVIIDIPYDGDFLLQKISYKSKVIGLDYVGQSKLDLVINVFDFLRYKGSNQISGLEYSIIREDITSLINQNFLCNKSVLIMLGSYDINNFALNIIQLMDDKNIETVVIEYEKSININHFNYCTHFVNPDNIAAIMQGCSWAVTNGGSSMLELMALGKAVHAIPQTEAESALANKIFKLGGLLGVGKPIKIPNNKYISDIAYTAQKIIDGRGVKRIMNHIKKLVE